GDDSLGNRSIFGSNKLGPEGETYLFLFTTHIQQKVSEDFIAWGLKGAANDWSSDPGKQFAAVGVTKDRVAAAWAKVQKDSSCVDQFCRRFVALTVVHEMGHAHGIDGHRPTPDGDESDKIGTRSCPMAYWEGRDNRLATMMELEGPGAGTICYVAT